MSAGRGRGRNCGTCRGTPRNRFLVTMRRALTRRCPYCGGPGIYEGYFALRERCPSCGVRFEREEGYFLGAYALNLIVAEFLGLGTGASS